MSTNTPATEQRLIAGNFDHTKRELEQLLAGGWRITHITGAPGPHIQGVYFAVVERAKQAADGATA